MSIFQTILTILLASVPIVLWGYVFSYYDGIVFKIHKFLFGGIAGAVSIVPIIYATEIYEYLSLPGFLKVLSQSQVSTTDFFSAFIASYWIPVVLFLVFLVVFSFSQIFQLKRTFFRIIGMIFGTSLLLAGIAVAFPTFGTGQLDIQGNIFVTLSSIIIVYIFIAFLEESMKHIALYGSIDSILERRDILLFAVYSALGFVFLENTIYLTNIGEHAGFGSTFFSTLFTRSVVSLLLHIFASLILALGFIKYTERIGMPAVFAFVQGLFGAVFVHMLFNVSLTYGKSGIILLYIFIGYFFFTKVFLDERRVPSMS
ncbi:MAG: PrsW family glutamic-type intramembrane protease [Candidatus Gracilibacteria bacterium]|nr:PrsW family glutamic-type intramembrane protease [Candidatus Gracilibacteria bacterium]